MAERKTGPVKPPTIDLTAREAKPGRAPSATTDEKPAASGPPETAAREHPGDAVSAAPPPSGTKATRDAKSAEGKQASPGSPARRPRVLFAGIGGALAGAVLGLAAAYGLAYYGFWPGTRDDAAVAALSDEVRSLYARKSDVGIVVDRSVGDVTSEVAELAGRVATLEGEIPGDPTPALGALDTRVAALETGLADLGNALDAAAIGGGDPAAENALRNLGTRLDDLAAAVAALEAAPTATQAELTALKSAQQAVADEVGRLATGLSALENAPAPAPVDLRLPLALSGLGTALETGAGYADELALIEAALPDLVVPAEVTAAAEAGLGTPAALEERFASLVPSILAARPADPDADWTEQVLNRLKSLVALRPVATAQGDTPEALVSRIEAALAAHDYRTAASALAALPPPMRAAAGDIDQSVGRFAALSDFVDRVRDAALVRAGAPT
jgi:hypothetical protein